MEAVRTSETSVYFYDTTRRCIPGAITLMMEAVHISETSVYFSARRYIPKTVIIIILAALRT
jgi:hypothetical protein